MNPTRIRTLTAGLSVANVQELGRLDAAIDFLTAARQRFEAAGYEVQTTRIATSPFLAALDARARDAALPALQALDARANDGGVIVSLGPVRMDDRADDALAEWAQSLVSETRTISFSLVIAADANVYARAALNAAQIMHRLAHSSAQGMANFRFAAAANIPAGTPFFPAAWAEGPESLAVGVEAASLVEKAFAPGVERPSERLVAVLDEELKAIEALARDVAQRAGRSYLGIDASPAPGLDRSIGAAVEALTGVPFGAGGTLHACALITAALKSLSVRTCGYSGLMLPVLEDSVLAQRASERRFTVRELLLYSSVCGTGLDVVPLPGDASIDSITRLLLDVAALSARLRKPLSARLFLAPGKKAGELASFNSPWLTDCRVMEIEE